jgi:hypothetical protein
MDQQVSSKWKIIRLIYLYLVSLIGLVVFIIGGVGLVDTGLRLLLNVDESYYVDAKQICRDPYRADYYGKRVPAPAEVAPAAPPASVDVNSQEYKNCVKDEDERQKKQEESNRRRDIAQALSMIILGTPVWLYHWFVIQREHKKQQQV